LLPPGARRVPPRESPLLGNGTVWFKLYHYPLL
jgi:hypothetical protein